ncbi:ABC transporter permease subunit [Bacillota bacterium Lsc_1132]
MGSLDLTTAIGYFGVLVLYLLLMTAIHALTLGANLVAKEERDRTAEFLLAKPISRRKMISAKLMAGLFQILILYLVALVSSIQVIAYYNKSGAETRNIVLLLLGMLLVQLLFLCLGAGIAAVSKRPKSAAGVGTVILLSTFLLSIVIDLNGKLSSLKFLTPFKHYEAKTILQNGGLDPLYVILLLGLIAGFVSVTYLFFTKRDMKI